ncbi:hypothetical protein A2Z33_02875 [Candidatus Gottesmanbacteria bacterium RBG_16_52_11]|uniref:Glycosyltransferase RgtA/B/C/D-like domain-containing protein n=1 Tax=Candidatus Gottesmanbacteria bacterium RBG_16_52_11 TaxID=1798374 RepID=A0A1F5YMW9_9BACT|nr:MAG: hypothetical protein A2Z33_02875 [Candidatus Gottesmanbacteria bacterium RBG_16_52_11]
MAFLVFIIPFLIYAFTRLFNLGLLPIFTDEAIYIRWSQIGSRDAAWRFISLTDGKQPLFTWIMMVFLRLIPGDPLVVGRLVSVFAGFVTLAGLTLLSYELFKSRAAALFTGLIYAVSPYTLMYDRLALYDSLVSALYVGSLYITVRLVRTLRLDNALILGMALGAGVLNKSSGFISIYLLPVPYLLFQGIRPTRRLFIYALLAALAAVLALVYYSVLRLSPHFHMIGLKNTVFVYTLSDWLSQPFRFFRGNLNGLTDWLIHYMTKPVLAASLLPLAVIWHRWREKTVLFLYFFLPFTGLALMGKVLYPRFILFMSMPLYVLAGVTFAGIFRLVRNRTAAATALILLLLPGITVSYFILTNPRYALIPESDRGQLIDDWPAGGGVRETTDLIRDRAQNGPVAVITDGTFGLLPYAFEIYLVDNPNVEIRGIWPVPETIPADIINLVRIKPTLVILNQRQVAPSWPMKLIAQYQKGNRVDRTLRVYEVEARPGPADENDPR